MTNDTQELPEVDVGKPPMNPKTGKPAVRGRLSGSRRDRVGETGRRHEPRMAFCDFAWWDEDGSPWYEPTIVGALQQFPAGEFRLARPIGR